MEPGSLQPMEPVLRDRVENRAGSIAQVKWDGIRIIAFLRDGAVTLQTKGGRIKANFPELGALAGTASQPLVLDGELVAIHQGRPDFARMLRRNFSHRPIPEVPVHYMVFDLLMHRGKDIRALSLQNRKGLLEDLSFEPGLVTVVEDYADGEALFAGVTQLGWEGIVVKELDSPYTPGKSDLWYKVKRVLSERLFVVGYTLNQGQLASLLVAKDFGAGLQLVGRVGSGLRAGSSRRIIGLLQEAAAKTPPVPGKKPANGFWIEPVLRAEVEFREWTHNLTLRAPVLKRLFVGEEEIGLSGN